MRRILTLASAVLAGMGLLGWGIPADAAAKSPDELKQNQPAGQTSGAPRQMAQAASSPSTSSGAQAASSPSSTSGAAASSSPSTSSGATAAGSPSTGASSSGAAASSSPSGTSSAASSQSGQQITDRDLEQHARAHAALEQKAPDAFSQLKTSKNPTADVKASDRQKIEQALQDTGLSFDEFARVHQQIVTDPQVRSRFAQVAQQSKAQAGATQSPASTSGAAASSSPSGTTSGAASSGAQPSSSPK
jgi:hypothetical protein